MTVRNKRRLQQNKQQPYSELTALCVQRPNVHIVKRNSCWKIALLEIFKYIKKKTVAES